MQARLLVDNIWSLIKDVNPVFAILGGLWTVLMICKGTVELISHSRVGMVLISIRLFCF
jgi:hypothetical protein